MTPSFGFLPIIELAVVGLFLIWIGHELEGKELHSKGFGQLTGPLCCRKDRVTVQEREAEALKQKELEQEAKRMAEERRKYTLKVLGVEDCTQGGVCVGLSEENKEPTAKSLSLPRL